MIDKLTTSIDANVNVPRVLVISSNAFDKVSGGGITFTNLFRGWPRERLACIHADPSPPDDTVCDHHYALTTQEFRLAPYLNLGGLLTRQQVPESNEPQSDGMKGEGITPQAGSPSFRDRIRAGVFSILRRGFAGEIPHTARLSPDLKKWIADFKPDLIYSILGSNMTMEMVNLVRKRFDLPVVIHFMDDWPSFLYSRGALSFIERRKMRRLLEKLMASAATRLTICPSMTRAYEKNYAHPFKAFQNTVDVDQWRPFSKSELSPAKPARLLYAGSVFPYAQHSSLADICRAVAELNDEGHDIEIEIASPVDMTAPFLSRYEIHPSIVVSDAIQDDETFYRRLGEADALLLPVNFDPFTFKWIRLSMPTKVPAYLASGTPILIYGPEGVAQVDYARDKGWGLVVSKQGVAQIKEGLVRLLSDVSLRQTLSQTATGLAGTDHDIKIVRAGFQKTLCESVISAR